MAWKVSCEPQGKNPGAKPQVTDSHGRRVGENEGGMVIYLEGNGSRQEVSRVAFVRRNSKNPKVSFDKQLKVEIEKAKQAAKLLDEQTADAGVLQ